MLTSRQRLFRVVLWTTPWVLCFMAPTVESAYQGQVQWHRKLHLQSRQKNRLLQERSEVKERIDGSLSNYAGDEVLLLTSRKLGVTKRLKKERIKSDKPSKQVKAPWSERRMSQTSMTKTSSKSHIEAIEQTKKSRIKDKKSSSGETDTIMENESVDGTLDDDSVVVQPSASADSTVLAPNSTPSQQTSKPSKTPTDTDMADEMLDASESVMPTVTLPVESTSDFNSHSEAFSSTESPNKPPPDYPPTRTIDVDIDADDTAAGQPQKSPTIGDSGPTVSSSETVPLPEPNNVPPTTTSVATDTKMPSPTNEPSLNPVSGSDKSCQLLSDGSFGKATNDRRGVDFFYQVETTPSVSFQTVNNALLPVVEEAIGTRVLAILFDECRQEATIQRGATDCEAQGYSSSPVDRALLGVSCIGTREDASNNCFVVDAGASLHFESKSACPDAVERTKMEIKNTLDSGSLDQLDERIVRVQYAEASDLDLSNAMKDDMNNGSSGDNNRFLLPVYAWALIGLSLIMLILIVALVVKRRRGSTSDEGGIDTEPALSRTPPETT